MIIIQARSTSTRFPQKVLQELWGDSVISHVYNRCRDAYPLVVVAIPQGDNVLREHLVAKSIPYFEGPEDDVLLRYFCTAHAYSAKWIIRVTSDCPLVSPAQIAFAASWMQRGCDFYSNCAKGCTDGQEVEGVSFKLLEHMVEHATDPRDREHVTTFAKERLGKDHGFKVAVYQDPWLIGQQKCSIDTPTDLEWVRAFKRDK